MSMPVIADAFLELIVVMNTINAVIISNISYDTLSLNLLNSFEVIIYRRKQANNIIVNQYPFFAESYKQLFIDLLNKYKNIYKNMIVGIINCLNLSPKNFAILNQSKLNLSLYANNPLIKKNNGIPKGRNIFSKEFTSLITLRMSKLK